MVEFDYLKQLKVIQRKLAVPEVCPFSVAIANNNLDKVYTVDTVPCRDKQIILRPPLTRKIKADPKDISIRREKSSV